jgi:hypothetical protein
MLFRRAIFLLRKRASNSYQYIFYFCHSSVVLSFSPRVSSMKSEEALSVVKAVAHRHPDVSEEQTTSVFRVEEHATQETSRTQDKLRDKAMRPSETSGFLRTA